MRFTTSARQRSALQKPSRLSAPNTNHTVNSNTNTDTAAASKEKLARASLWQSPRFITTATTAARATGPAAMLAAATTNATPAAAAAALAGGHLSVTAPKPTATVVASPLAGVTLPPPPCPPVVTKAGATKLKRTNDTTSEKASTGAARAVSAASVTAADAKAAVNNESLSYVAATATAIPALTELPSVSVDETTFFSVDDNNLTSSEAVSSGNDSNELVFLTSERGVAFNLLSVTTTNGDSGVDSAESCDSSSVSAVRVLTRELGPYTLRSPTPGSFARAHSRGHSAHGHDHGLAHRHFNNSGFSAVTKTESANVLDGASGSSEAVQSTDREISGNNSSNSNIKITISISNVRANGNDHGDINALGHSRSDPHSYTGRCTTTSQRQQQQQLH